MKPECAIETIDGFEVRISRSDGKPLLFLVRMASGGIRISDTIWDNLSRYFTVANFDIVWAANLEADLSPRDRFVALANTLGTMSGKLGFGSYNVFGWYGGCHVALAALTHQADRVSSCILLDPFFELPDMRKTEKAIASKRNPFESADRELYAYYWVMAGFSAAFLERNFDVAERLAKARIETDRFVSLDPDRWMRWVRALRTNWLAEVETSAIETPTLILATELDSWHAGPTVEMATSLESLRPGPKLKVIEKRGTFFFLEDPALFAEEALPFMATHSVGPDRAPA